MFMKIKQIYIKAFSELRDTTLDLSSNLQIIFNENKNNELLIKQFLVVMFYGFSADNNLTKIQDRKQYFSKANQKIGGTILFSFQTEDYSLERIFEINKANDQIRLTNNSSSEEVVLKNKNQPGFDLFQISESEFSDEVFQAKLPTNNQEFSILSSKIDSDLLDYVSSSQQIQNRLEKAHNNLFLEHTNKGYIQELLAKKNNLIAELEDSIEKDKQIAYLNREIFEAELELTQLQQREENLNLQKLQHQKLVITNNYTRYHNLSRELEQIKRQEIPENNVLKTDHVSVKDLAEIASQRQSVSNIVSELEIKQNLLAKRLEEKQNHIAEQKKQKAEILKERSRLNYLQKVNKEKKPRKFKPIQMSFASFIPLTIIEVFLLIGGLLLRKTLPTLSVIAIVLAVLLPLLIVFLYFVLQRQHERNYNRYKQAVRNHKMRTLKIENKLQDLEFSLERIENRGGIYDEEILLLTEQLEQIESIYEREKNKLRYLIKPFFTEIPDDDQLDKAIAFLREKTVDNVQSEEKENQIRQEMETLRQNLTAVEFEEQYENAQEWLMLHQSKIRTFPEYTENHIIAQLAGIKEQYRQLDAQLSTAKTNLQFLQNSEESTIEIEAMLNETLSKLEKNKFRYYALDLAQYLVNHCKQNFDEEISPKLYSKVAEYLSIMLGDKYDELEIKSILNERNSNSRLIEEKVELALYLATRAINQDQNLKLPIIIDEPFSQAGKPRNDQTLHLLEKISKDLNRQILIFTSSSWVKAELNNFNENQATTLIYL